MHAVSVSPPRARKGTWQPQRSPGACLTAGSHLTTFARSRASASSRALQKKCGSLNARCARLFDLFAGGAEPQRARTSAAQWAAPPPHSQSSTSSAGTARHPSAMGTRSPTPPAPPAPASQQSRRRPQISGCRVEGGMKSTGAARRVVRGTLFVPAGGGGETCNPSNHHPNSPSAADPRLQPARAHHGNLSFSDRPCVEAGKTKWGTRRGP